MKIILLFLFCILSADFQAHASTANDYIYSPPKMIRRSFNVSLSECLATFGPALVSNVAYGCKVTVAPPNRGEAIPYRTTLTTDLAVYTRIILTPEGERFSASMKIYLEPDGVRMTLRSDSINPRTGTSFVIQRADAIAEITRIWEASNLNARTWSTHLWLFQ